MRQASIAEFIHGVPFVSYLFGEFERMVKYLFKPKERERE